MYAKYFSILIKTQGVPHLDGDQWRRLQNIGAVEYHIQRINDMGVKHSLFKEVMKEQSKLDSLTKKLPPEELIREMIELSR